MFPWPCKDIHPSGSCFELRASAPQSTYVQHKNYVLRKIYLCWSVLGAWQNLYFTQPQSVLLRLPHSLPQLFTFFTQLSGRVIQHSVLRTRPSRSLLFIRNYTATMQLTNAIIGAMLATGAIAAPHTHGGKRGSSILARARKFGNSKIGGGGQDFGGDEGSWGFGQGGGYGSSQPSATAAGGSKPTGTSSPAGRASSSSVPSYSSSSSDDDSSTSSSASSDDSSTSTSTSDHSSISSSSSFSSLTTMSNTQWAGAGYSGLYNSGETLKGVSTTFNVLDASVPTDADTGLSTYYASAWIGIDGQGTCSSSDAGLWQAGVDSMVDSSGTLSFYACKSFTVQFLYQINLGSWHGSRPSMGPLAVQETHQKRTS